MALSKVSTNQIDTAATPTVAEATVTGDLTVDTNTLYVDATNNRVGVGTTSPASDLHVVTSDYKAAQLEGPRPTLFFKETDGSADQNFQVRVDGGHLLFQQQNDAQSNASTKVSMLQGGGLTFNGDTAAANALDDYEEGTWTPTSGVGSAAANSGHYTKVGRLVTVYGDITFTGSGTVNADIDGLPYTVAAPQTGGAVGWNNIASGTMIIAVSGNARLALYNGLSSLVTIPNGGRILFGVSYQTS